MDLVTQAAVVAALPDLKPAQVSALPGLIAAVSRAIERYCKRGLALASRDETHRPGMTRTVRLKHSPVASIARVCTGLADVLTVVNTDPATTRAGVTLSATALTLARSAPGSPAAVPIDLATVETISDLAEAVNAVGDGWEAALAGLWDGWLVSDLNPLVGSQDARLRPLALKAFVRDLAYNALDPSLGLIEILEGRPEAFRFPDRGPNHRGYGSWLQGDPRVADVRVVYTAGYDVEAMPADIAEAAIVCIRAALDGRKASGLIKSATMGNASYTVADGDAARLITPYARELLSPWRARSL